MWTQDRRHRVDTRWESQRGIARSADRSLTSYSGGFMRDETQQQEAEAEAVRAMARFERAMWRKRVEQIGVLACLIGIGGIIWWASR